MFKTMFSVAKKLVYLSAWPVLSPFEMAEKYIKEAAFSNCSIKKRSLKAVFIVSIRIIRFAGA